MALPNSQIAITVPVEPWADIRQTKADRDRHLEVAIIDDRPLIRDCFGRGLETTDPDLSLRYFSGVGELENSHVEDSPHTRVGLLCATWSSDRAGTCFKEIEKIRTDIPSISIIVLSDIERIDDVLKLIECGARGYIPTSVSLDVAVKAIQLVAAGGVYLPASILFLANRMAKQASQADSKTPEASLFTSRQMSVIEALRRGKPNKIIAYELNMCESTVKVHIRNIMRRMKARNRTEVAYLLNNMLRDREGVRL